jgi:hypothetical protein
MVPLDGRPQVRSSHEERSAASARLALQQAPTVRLPQQEPVPPASLSEAGSSRRPQASEED